MMYWNWFLVEKEILETSFGSLGLRNGFEVLRQLEMTV